MIVSDFLLRLDKHNILQFIYFAEHEVLKSFRIFGKVFILIFL